MGDIEDALLLVFTFHFRFVVTGITGPGGRSTGVAFRAHAIGALVVDRECVIEISRFPGAGIVTL